jgi:preprotein translocase subunit Sss1
MTTEALRAFFRAGVFVTVVSLGLVLAVRRDSAEFVISVCSMGIGIVLIGLVLFVHWLSER